jgi:multiple sugar transport system substrate-binding protein
VSTRLLRRSLATAAALALVLSACGGSQSAETTTAAGGNAGTEKIAVFLIPSPNATAITALAEDFTAETGIEVQISETPYGEAHQKQILAFQAGGGQYDVVQFDNTFLANFGSNGFLEPLQDRIASSEVYDIDDFSPAIQDYGDYQGDTLGLILSTEPFLLWYRTDIYDELGLSVPETWDDYLANAAVIQDSGLGGGQILGYTTPVNAWWWYQLVWSFGGDLYDDDLNPTVNTPEAIAATEFYVETLSVSSDGAISVGGDDTTNQFISADTGQMIQYSGYHPLVVDPETSSFADRIATARVPRGEADVVHLAGWNIGIPADSANKDAAWQFLEYVMGKPNAKKFLEEGAAAPGRISTTTDPELLAETPYLELLNIPADVRVERYPQLAVYPEFEKTVGDVLANILSGQISVEDGLAEMQEKLTDVLAEEPR